MTLWFVFALMTAAAIFAVLWPLGQRRTAQGDASEANEQVGKLRKEIAK